MASQNLSNEEKQKISDALLRTEETEVEMGKPPTARVYEDSQLSDFVTDESWLFFKVCKLRPDFLRVPSAQWIGEETYQKFCFIVKGLPPFNDPAERAVKLGTDYHGRIVQDPVQHEALLQSVESHRREFPKAVKK